METSQSKGKSHLCAAGNEQSHEPLLPKVRALNGENRLLVTDQLILIPEFKITPLENKRNHILEKFLL